MEIKINIPKNDYVQPTDIRENVVQILYQDATDAGTKSLIEQIIRAESSKVKRNAFNIFNYVNKEKSYAGTKMASVYHDNGNMVASDGIILVAVKSD